MTGPHHAFSGTWATVLLPLDNSDRIDTHLLRDEVDILAGSGVQGVYTNGTAGEFDLQTEREFDVLTTLVADRCGDARMPFMIGVSHPSPPVMRGRLRRATAFEPAGVQFILPAWSPLNDREVIDFCRRIEDEAHGLPLVLYSPPHARRTLDPQMFGRLVESVSSLAAAKLVDGDEDWYAQMKHHAKRLALFVPGHALATGYSRGAAGSFSNVACLNPVGAARWWRQMQDDLPAALGLEARIRAFLGQHIAPHLRGPHALSHQAADKLLAAIGGWAEIGTRVRWPYRGFENHYAQSLRAIARRDLPELLVSTTSTADTYTTA